MIGRFRQRITSVVAVAITMALPPTLFAQQATGVGTIEGTIREAGTGRPLEGVQVGVTGANIGAATNGRGQYRITNVPARTVELRIRLVGFTPSNRTVVVTAGQIKTADFEISQSVLQLEAVVTTGTGGAVEVKKLG